jgi:tetraacyldisaccharide-1-P 4'-kinase
MLAAQVVVRRSFADHHAYTRQDIEAILLAAQADVLPVTTEKTT